MRINWTDPALDDLDALFAYIAKDAPGYAQSFIAQIMAAVDRLETFPRSGRRVPEADRDDIREVIFQSYRILYWILDAERIDVLAVLHGSRDLARADALPWEVM